MKKLQKIDWFLIIFLAVLVVLTILCIFFPEIASIFDLGDITNAESGITFDLGTGLFWVAVACFLGALVPFPVPYVLIVGIVASHFVSDPTLGWGAVILMVIFATIVNSIGDFIDWIIGYGGGELSEKAGSDSLLSEIRNAGEGKELPDNIWAKLVFKNPAVIPFLLLLFGLTPLPDSLLFIPLGMINYSLKKTMFWNAVGKFFMMLIVALMGIFWFENMFLLLGGGGGETGWISGIIVLYASWGIMAVMTKIGSGSEDKGPKEITGDKPKKKATKVKTATSKSEFSEKIQKIVDVSDRINIAMMRKLLNMDEDTFNANLIDWAKEFGFRIDGEYLVINKERIDDFIDMLDASFKEWGDKEKRKIEKG